MKKIHCLNPIAKCGTELFPADYELTAHMAEADGILVRSASMHDMEFPENLKAVGRAGAGVNNIPLDVCAEAGIVVFNTPGANANGVKELVIAGMLMASRDIVGGIEWCRANAEDDNITKDTEKSKKAFAGCEIKGKKLGVVGLGAIGAEVANAATHLGMEVYGYDPYISVNAAWRLSRNVKHITNVDTIFQDCDYITIHVPLLDSTKGMINSEKLEMMKDGVVILNFSRDTLVNDDDMAAALESGKVRYYVSDFPNPKVANMKNVILLPHLGAEQGERKLSDGIRAEELNILIGSDAVDDENVKEAVKLNTMILLNEKYGITEKEFMRAEIEITPAYKCRDVGFDRSMVGGYGHDDRVDAYPALMAEIETKNPAYTTVCVLTDKEEIGSDGVTGMQSMYAFHFMQELCRAAGQDDILAFRHSVCLSADVTAAYDPTWASAFEPMNGTYAGRGVAIFKYTGGGSKGSASDACAELVSDITRMLDNGNVAWQIGELGRLDLGGGGTIAKYVANRGIPVLDIGVPVLSMHAPFEVIHKNDLYMAYRAFSLFNNAQ